MLNASDIMTRSVITVTPETSIKDLAGILTRNNISGAVVVDNDEKVIGVVTGSDLIFQNKKLHIPAVVAILDSYFFLEKPKKMGLEMQKIAGATVGDIFSQKVTAVQEDATIADIATIMSEQHIHTLPVLKDDTLVGVIGKKDIIKTIAAGPAEKPTS
jgi:CBS domain-containing protein